MVKKQNIGKRSPMNVSIGSRLLGVSITVFVLILTIKSELLENEIIILQLVLSIPLLIASMITNAKIVDFDSLKKYYLINRITNSISIAFICNTMGLLITRYVSFSIGIAFFALTVLLLGILLCIDFNKRKYYNELLMILLILLLGLIPAVLFV